MLTKWLRKRVLAGEFLAGCWLNLGSPTSAEIAGLTGFDWALVDQEHGITDYSVLNAQIQALAASTTAPLVRIAWNDPILFKLVLDLGASGVMVPYINTAEQAKQAVASTRYPPTGRRGVASSVRAGSYGREFNDYFAQVNDNMLLVVQIETCEALENVNQIAAVEGVDVLFIGPLDLSVSLGIAGQMDHPDFRAAVAKICAAARSAGKATGILLRSLDQIPGAVADGFTLMACGADRGMLVSGMQSLADAYRASRSGA